MSNRGNALARICQPGGLVSSHAAKPRVSNPSRVSLIKDVGIASQQPALLSTRSMEHSGVVLFVTGDRAVTSGLVVKRYELHGLGCERRTGRLSFRYVRFSGVIEHRCQSALMTTLEYDLSGKRSTIGIRTARSRSTVIRQPGYHRWLRCFQLEAPNLERRINSLQRT